MQVFSILQWEYELVNVLLQNVVEVGQEKEQENVFLFKFEMLMSLHSYLDQLIEYLVLYYCCFDAELWIAVFYCILFVLYVFVCLFFVCIERNVCLFV